MIVYKYYVVMLQSFVSMFQEIWDKFKGKYKV